MKHKRTAGLPTAPASVRYESSRSCLDRSTRPVTSATVPVAVRRMSAVRRGAVSRPASVLVRVIDEAFRRKRELNHEKHERHELEDIRRGESGNTVRQAPVAVRVSGLAYPIQYNPVLSCSCLSCLSWLKIGSGLSGPSHPAGHIRNRPDYSATISKALPSISRWCHQGPSVSGEIPVDAGASLV